MPLALAVALEVAGTARTSASGSSMFPFIASGARVWLERCDLSALRRGDVVAFEHEGHVVLHRLQSSVSRRTRERGVPGGARRIVDGLRVRGDAQSTTLTIEPRAFVGRVQGIVLGRRQWRSAPSALVAMSGRAVLALAPMYVAVASRRSRAPTWRLMRVAVRSIRRVLGATT